MVLSEIFACGDPSLGSKNSKECMSCNLAPGSACYFGGGCRTKTRTLQAQRTSTQTRALTFRYRPVCQSYRLDGNR